MTGMVPVESGDIKLGIIGCGTMGKCIMTAILESGTLEWSQVRGTANKPETIAKLKRLYPAAEFERSNGNITAWANVILIWYLLKVRC
jgi:pyrroline-5-carboxylate reductase